MVFSSHFSRGFGLQMSRFFKLLLDSFDLQPHHLGPNSILQLSSFVTLCEGYLGLLPFVDLWRNLVYLKCLKNGNDPYAYGGRWCASAGRSSPASPSSSLSKDGTGRSST